MQFLPSMLNRANPRFWLAVAWGLLWGWVLPQTPLMNGELATGDSVVRLLPHPIPAPVEIVLFTGQNGLVDRPAYSRRVEQLLAGGARGIIINLPVDFGLPLKLPGQVPLGLPKSCITLLETNLDCPLAQVLTRYYAQLILVTAAQPGSSPQQVNVYNHFQSFTADGQAYRHPLEQVLAVTGISPDRDGVVRHQTSPDWYTDIFNSGPWRLSPVALLAAQKWGQPFDTSTEQNLRFLPDELIETRPIPAICPVAEPCQVRGKIIILGYHQSPDILTPVGWLTSLQVEAQMLSSIFDRASYHRLSVLLQGLAILGETLLWVIFLNYFAPSKRPLPPLALWFALWGLVSLGWLGLVYLSVLAFELLLPTFFILGAITFTTVSIYISELWLRARAAFFAQQEELENLRKAERQAILNQARKLLYRVATDIHDRQLQQLKLVMDDLENCLDRPQPENLEPILQELGEIGLGIRNELTNLRSLADKLEISPELKSGLHEGIRVEFNKMWAKGELLLIPVLELEPLTEPLDQSQWLDAREDIFRFFREALANALRHGRQGTYVYIRLQQTEAGAELTIENDGVMDSISISQNQGGYGTKAMNTISASLHEGQWQRDLLDNERVCVSLRWNMQAYFPKQAVTMS